MSRSRKKNPILKDNGESHKWSKKNANQRVRAATRNILNNLDPLEDKIFPTQKGKELTNQYDICDYRSILPNKENWFVYHNRITGELVVNKITDKDKRNYYKK